MEWCPYGCSRPRTHIVMVLGLLAAVSTQTGAAEWTGLPNIRQICNDTNEAELTVDSNRTGLFYFTPSPTVASCQLSLRSDGTFSLAVPGNMKATVNDTDTCRQGPEEGWCTWSVAADESSGVMVTESLQEGKPPFTIIALTAFNNSVIVTWEGQMGTTRTPKTTDHGTSTTTPTSPTPSPVDATTVPTVSKPPGNGNGSSGGQKTNSSSGDTPLVPGRGGSGGVTGDGETTQKDTNNHFAILVAGIALMLLALALVAAVVGWAVRRRRRHKAGDKAEEGGGRQQVSASPPWGRGAASVTGDDEQHDYEDVSADDIAIANKDVATRGSSSNSGAATTTARGVTPPQGRPSRKISGHQRDNSNDYSHGRITSKPRQQQPSSNYSHIKSGAGPSQSERSRTISDQSQHKQDSNYSHIKSGAGPSQSERSRKESLQSQRRQPKAQQASSNYSHVTPGQVSPKTSPPPPRGGSTTPQDGGGDGDDYNTLDLARSTRHSQDEGQGHGPPVSACPNPRPPTTASAGLAAGKMFFVGDENDDYSQIDDIYDVVDDDDQQKDVTPLRAKPGGGGGRGGGGTPVGAGGGKGRGGARCGGETGKGGGGSGRGEPEDEQVYEDCSSQDCSRQTGRVPTPTGRTHPASNLPTPPCEQVYEDCSSQDCSRQTGRVPTPAGRTHPAFILPTRPTPPCPTGGGLRRHTSRSVENIKVEVWRSRGQEQRKMHQRTQSVDLNHLQDLCKQRDDFLHTYRSQGDGAEMDQRDGPRETHDASDYAELEPLPDATTSQTAAAALKGVVTQEPRSQLSAAPPGGQSPVKSGFPQPDRGQAAPLSKQSPSVSPEAVSMACADQSIATASATPPPSPRKPTSPVMLRRKISKGSRKSLRQQEGHLSMVDKVKNINRELLEIGTAVRQSMEIQADELVMIDNVIYGTLPRNSSLPTTEL